LAIRLSPVAIRFSHKKMDNEIEMLADEDDQMLKTSEQPGNGTEDQGGASTCPTIRKSQLTSNGVRRLVAQAIVDEHMSIKEAARSFGINPKAVTKIASVYRNEGRLIKKKR
jgi:hypothetical protein